MLGGADAEVGSLDAQRGVVRHHHRRAETGLSEGGADDPVVRDLRIEPVLDEQMLLDAVDLDLDGAGSDRHGLGERTTVLDAQVLDRAQRGTCRTPDVVRPCLEAVELLDDREWYHERGVAERGQAVRVGNQHRCVDDTAGAAAHARRVGDVAARCIA